MNAYEPLLTWLAWNAAADDQRDAFRDARLGWLARQLGAELAGTPDDLAPMWQALSLNATARILRAPAICQALRVEAPPGVLRRAVTAEYILDQRPEMHVDHWSALGDVWLGEAPPAPHAPVLHRRGDGRYQAPALACGIPIDLSLPAVVAYPAAGVPDPQFAGVRDTAASVARLDGAMTRIAGASAAMREAVTDLVSNIVLRRDPAAPRRLQSASSAAALGRIVLVNAHARANTEALLAEVLLHEATHTAVSTVELAAPLVCDAASLMRCCIPSPWTGASLPVHAFLHACLVWFALSGFWARMEHTAEAAERLDFIRQGFETLAVDGTVAPYRDRLHRDAIPLLHAVREKALAA